MSTSQIVDLSRKQAILGLEERLLKQAAVLYKCGFKSISAAQMAAVGERVCTEPTISKARNGVGKFLCKQIDKLTKKEKDESWRTPLQSGSKQRCLGEELKSWLADEKYLPAPKESYDDSVRLTALRRFWSYLHAMYRYEKVFKEVMWLDHTQTEKR